MAAVIRRQQAKGVARPGHLRHGGLHQVEHVVAHVEIGHAGSLDQGAEALGGADGGLVPRADQGPGQGDVGLDVAAGAERQDENSHRIAPCWLQGSRSVRDGSATSASTSAVEVTSGGSRPGRAGPAATAMAVIPAEPAQFTVS